MTLADLITKSRQELEKLDDEAIAQLMGDCDPEFSFLDLRRQLWREAIRRLLLRQP